MTLSTVLIANRGEVAIRIARACADLGLRSVAIAGADDAGSLHLRRADQAWTLPGRGVPWRRHAPFSPRSAVARW